MLVEVIQRRFCGQDKKRKLPDILLVDGGKGQLHSIVKALEEMKICIPAVIGLAKKKEEIFVPNQEEPIDQNDLAKQLFCRVRDEAHRFAQKYHHWLQKKSLFPDC
jgi:excinuclease ABC subunit C